MKKQHIILIASLLILSNFCIVRSNDELTNFLLQKMDAACASGKFYEVSKLKQLYFFLFPNTSAAKKARIRYYENLKSPTNITWYNDDKKNFSLVEGPIAADFSIVESPGISKNDDSAEIKVSVKVFGQLPDSRERVRFSHPDDHTTCQTYAQVSTNDVGNYRCAMKFKAYSEFVKMMKAAQNSKP